VKKLNLLRFKAKNNNVNSILIFYKKVKTPIYRM